MVEYFESLGWVYVNLCGCSENYKVYTNSAIPDWQVWVHQLGTKVKFMRVWSPSSIETKGMAGSENYKVGYEYWVVNSEKQIS